MNERNQPLIVQYLSVLKWKKKKKNETPQEVYAKEQET